MSPLREKLIALAMRTFGKKRGQSWAMIVLDHKIPSPDRDAGSRSTLHYIRMFLEMGLKVKFIAGDFQFPQPYTEQLAKLGVEILGSNSNQESIQRWLVEHESEIGFVFSNRPHVTNEYLETFRKMPRTKILYYGHDVAYVRYQRAFSLCGRAEDAASAAHWEQVETAIWQQVDVVYYPSEEETALVLSRAPAVAAQTLPLYHLVPKDTDDTANFIHRRHLIFVGGFEHHPNQDAVLWFVENCWPLIAQSLPGVCIYIVGGSPNAEIKMQNSSRVIVTGWVDEITLSDLYQNSRLAVVPLRYGAGVKGKVVEALHHGVPIVMTSIGAEGLSGIEAFAIVADRPKDFADAVISLYHDVPSLERMAKEGQAYVNKHFSRSNALRILRRDVQ